MGIESQRVCAKCVCQFYLWFVFKHQIKNNHQTLRDGKWYTCRRFLQEEKNVKKENYLKEKRSRFCIQSLAQVTIRGQTDINLPLILISCHFLRGNPRAANKTANTNEIHLAKHLLLNDVSA